MVKMVVFDLDGTLMNSLTDLAISVNYGLKLNGLEEKPVETKIVSAHLKMCGYNDSFKIEWDKINLQDAVELSQARLNNANAMNIERQIGAEVQNEG